MPDDEEVDAPFDLSFLGNEVAKVVKRFHERPRETLATIAPAVVKAAPARSFGDRSAEKRFDELVRWGVPHKIALLLVGARERDVETTEALAKVNDFLAGDGGGRENVLVLAGSMGTGKTVAAARFLEAAEPPLPFGRGWKADQRPRWYHAADLVALCHRRDGMDTDEERRQIKIAKAIAIDDLGVEYADGKGFWMAFCDWLVNARIEAPGCTVVTTNLLAKERRTVKLDSGETRILPSFKERYGDRVYDRLREAAIWENVGGPSLRGG